jgi:hypothetical protein
VVVAIVLAATLLRSGVAAEAEPWTEEEQACA